MTEADIWERRSLLGDENEDRGPGRPLPAICDPSHVLHRVVVLIFMCFLGFGSYFCYDNPAALQTQVIQRFYFCSYLKYCWLNFNSII
uniref:Uncharacterized protein n=1 Tax=Poecilia mexicana TaxID=48701 RepID=A0A3B3Y1W3_9TELE